MKNKTEEKSQKVNQTNKEWFKKNKEISIKFKNDSYSTWLKNKIN